jgi:tetratricopeptide (TPR) repeat protein
LSTAQANWSLVLEARRRRLPKEDESLLSLRVDLARIAVLKGRQKEAESELLAVVELARRSEKHAAFSRALFVLGTLRRNQKRLAEAEQAFIQSLQFSDRFLGEGSADSALSLLELAKLSLGKRLPQEALEFSRRAAKFSSEQGPTELVWLDLAEIHAQVLRKLGRKGDAESVAAFVTKARQEQERSRNVVDITELIAK